MILTIKKLNKIDVEKIMLEIFLVLGMFYGQLGRTSIWKLIIYSILVFLIVLSKKYQKGLFHNKLLLISIGTYIVLVVINVMASSGNTYFMDNMSLIVLPLIITVSVSALSYQDHEYCLNHFNSNFVFINAIWVLNLIVLAIQVAGYPLFIRDAWLEINPFYPDQCCGLFGNSGTHSLALFSSFILVYNLYYSYYHVPIHDYALAIRVYTFLTELLMLLLSIYNENIMFFLLIPSFYLFFYFIKHRYTFNRKISRNQLRLIVIIVISLILLYNLLPNIKEYVIDYVIPRIKRMLVQDKNSINGSNERLAIALYSIQGGWALRFGKGIGFWPIHKGGLFGFRHFGLSSIGSFLTLGGVWFYLGECLFFVICSIGFSKHYARYKKSLYVYELLIIILISAYTNIFTSWMSCIWMILILFYLDELRNSCVRSQEHDKYRNSRIQRTRKAF